MLMPLLAGCPVDDRTLGNGEASTAGSVSEAGTSAGSAVGGSEESQGGDPSVSDDGGHAAGEAGATAGNSGGPPVSGGVGGVAGVGGHVVLGGAGGHADAKGGAGASTGGGSSGSGAVCPSANRALVPGCQGSLASNATFETDGAGWTAELNAVEIWQPIDADGRGASGALSVQNTVAESSAALAFTGARQCVSVVGGTPYRLTVKLRIASGQDSSAAGGLNVGFFASVDCSGNMLAPLTSNLPRDADSWLVASALPNAPQSARSMSVRLVAMKAFSAPPVTVVFDDVLVTTP